jgi:hypothetical protein
MAEQNITDVALAEVAHMLAPLKSLNNADKVTLFFSKLGYTLPGGDVSSSFTVTLTKTDAVISAAKDLMAAEDAIPKMQALTNLMLAVKDVVDEMKNLTNAVKAVPGLALNFVNNAPLNDIPLRLLDYLIYEDLYARHPKLFGVLLLMGILDEKALTADATKFQPACNLKVVKWERIPRYMTEPGAVIDELYNWSDDFDSDLFVKRFEIFLKAMAIPGGVYKQSANVKAALGNTTNDLNELRTPIFQKGIYPGVHTLLGVNFTPAEVKSGKKKGIAVIPYFVGSLQTTFDINEKWEALLNTSLTLDAGVGLILRPPFAMEILNTIFTAPANAATIDASLTGQQKKVNGSIPAINIFGSETSTHMSMKDVSTKIFAKSSSRGQDAGIEISIKAIEIALSPDGGDSFLAKILPEEGINATFGLGMGISLLNGFYFTGSSSIEIQLPVHISLGPIEIDSILIAIKPENRKIPIDIAATIRAELGPIKLVVENVGVTTTLSFPANNSGNLGVVDAQLGFKPPNGVGISIDAGIVKGGGYLFLDFDKGEYAGALQLSIEGFLSLNAIGLITTKMPDGSPGFSMLIIITAEFMPAFQLGYGFTLIGVGGLLGLNRVVLLDPLRDGVRTGAINNIMFPTDVVTNAPRIISDLKAIFPVKEGYFLVGPMAKIGWGTPTLISLSLGVIVQLPDPKIAILGVLKIALPTEEVSILKLQVNFLGTIDPANMLITFDASLFESHLLYIMKLTGDMAVRLKWGDKPDFILSAGGFHPDYEPTMSMPTLQRLGIVILNQDYARIKVETYFAVTSNTVQFGAKADCYFGLDGFSVYGDIGYDALIQFSPFTFQANASANFTIDTAVGDASVYVRALLKGPTPWYVNATGGLKICGIKFEANFEHEWGQSNNDVLPSIAIRQKVIDEFTKNEVWHTELPEGKIQLASIANSAADGTTPPLVIHPYGSLIVSQKFIPFKLTLDKIGNQTISDVNKVSISKVAVGTTQAALTDVKDNFATAQFKNLSDAKKLSLPSFEKMCCGVNASFAQGSTDFEMGTSLRRSLAYEQIFVDKDEKKRPDLYKPNNFKDLLNGTYIKKSKLSDAYSKKLGKLVVTKPIEPTYDIVNVLDNQSLNIGVFNTKIEAEDAIKNIVSLNAALKGQVVLIQKN